jgi:hypothetical protein
LFEVSNNREKRQRAAFTVAQKFDAGERLTVRKLAKMVTIPRSTAARWLNEGFQKKWKIFGGSKSSATKMAVPNVPLKNKCGTPTNAVIRSRTTLNGNARI